MARSELIEILKPAYEPCKHFYGACSGQCKWEPKSGFVPNGFGGAKGKLSEVKLVIVAAEPGKPLSHTNYEGAEVEMVKESMKILENALDKRGVVRKTGFYGQFHENLLLILEKFWKGDSLEEILRKTWFTNTVLCPAPSRRVKHTPVVIETCIQNYLIPQLELFKDSHFLILSKDAKERTRDLEIKSCSYGFHPSADMEKYGKLMLDSWEKAAKEFHTFLRT